MATKLPWQPDGILNGSQQPNGDNPFWTPFCRHGYLGCWVAIRSPRQFGHKCHNQTHSWNLMWFQTRLPRPPQVQNQLRSKPAQSQIKTSSKLIQNQFKTNSKPVQSQFKSSLKLVQNQFYQVPFYCGWSLLNEVLPRLPRPPKPPKPV